MRLTISDLKFTNDFLNDPSIYPFITDDFNNGIINSEILLNNESVYFLSPDPCSLFIFHPMTTILYQGHMQCRKGLERKPSWVAGREAIDWMFKNTKCKKIMGLTPSYCGSAVNLAIKCGFKIEGILAKSFFKNGKLFDQVITGLAKK